MAPERFPAGERVDRPGRDAALVTLEQRQELVPEAVAVELPVRLGQRAGLMDGAVQQRCKALRGGGCH